MPLSSAFLMLAGAWLQIVVAALPSRFECRNCGRLFRRYTWPGVVTLTVIALLLGAVLWSWARYVLWLLTTSSP